MQLFLVYSFTLLTSFMATSHAVLLIDRQTDKQSEAKT